MIKPNRRNFALYTVVAVVLLCHAFLTQSLIQQMMQANEENMSIERMEARLVAEMKLSEPPVVKAKTAAPPAESLPTLPTLADAVAQPASAASSPEPPASAASTPEAPASQASEPEIKEETIDEPMAANVAETASSAPAFEWPLATRVTYKMQGYLRGPIQGRAFVQWVRQEMKYQVHVDAYAGPSFAPIASQRWASEGTITPNGLVPSRFEAINKLLIKSSTPKVVIFEDTSLVLPNGERIDKLPGAQDPASHYIQMAYQFMMDSKVLQVGNTVEIPMASTKKQQILIYDIQAKETLVTPLGDIETFRLQPRLPAKTSKGEDLLADIWIAPSLQYLPIRMLIRVGEEVYFNMSMDRAPQQTLDDGGNEIIDADQ